VIWHALGLAKASEHHKDTWKEQAKRRESESPSPFNSGTTWYELLLQRAQFLMRETTPKEGFELLAVRQERIHLKLKLLAASKCAHTSSRSQQNTDCHTDSAHSFLK
jgi:hypothetical protein